MTLEEFCNIETDINVPLVYGETTETEDRQSEVTVPYMAYVEEGKNTDVKADNKIYYKCPQIKLELYTEGKDFAKEKLITNWLDEHDIEYEEEHTGNIPAEGCKVHLVIYRFEL